MLFFLRIVEERGSFYYIRKDLGYRVEIWDIREVVGFFYLDILKKIVDGFFFGVVCI